MPKCESEKFTLTGKIFCQINCLVIFFDKPLLSRHFCQFLLSAREITMWKSAKFSLLHKIFSMKSVLYFFSNSFVKTLLSRNFRQKCVRVNLRNFQTAIVRNISPIFRHFNDFFPPYFYVLTIFSSSQEFDICHTKMHCLISRAKIVNRMLRKTL